MSIRRIKKVAVIGSGIMGSGIACHFANIGVDVLLLNRTGSDEGEADKGFNLNTDSSNFKIQRVNRLLEKTVNSEPYPLYKKEFISRIKTGNLDTDLPLIRDYDWVVESVTEDAEVKKKLFIEVEKFRKEGSIVTTNTSGIPIRSLSEGRSKDFQKHFCGVHFFNPPRYLQLLEIIPTYETDPELVEFLQHYGDFHLGKDTIVCNDNPGFIANRIGVMVFLNVFRVMNDLGLGVAAVDKLTGPISGRAKTATFRTADMVGLDTFISLTYLVCKS